MEVKSYFYQFFVKSSFGKGYVLLWQDKTEIGFDPYLTPIGPFRGLEQGLRVNLSHIQEGKSHMIYQKVPSV